MMNKKKVLVLTSSFPRNSYDWWAQFVLNLHAHVNKENYETIIIAPHAPGAQLTETMLGIHVKRFPYFYPYSLEKLTSGSGILHSGKTSILAFIQIPTFIFMETLTAIAELSKQNYNIIHAHWIIPQGFIVCIGKFLYKKPLFITVHGSDLFGLKHFGLVKTMIIK